MWEDILSFQYEDYELESKRKIVLKRLRTDFNESLLSTIKQFENDTFSNSSAIHVSGSEKQSENFSVEKHALHIRKRDE